MTIKNPFAVTYHWGPSATTTTQLWLDVRNPHPEFGTAFSMFEDIVETLVGWRRPIHLSWVWQHYQTELQPIDKRRRGVGWLGWIPFELAHSEVPQAEIARSIAGGDISGVATRLLVLEWGER